jgi:HD-like signal output (HDOD) protein/ActR/RegA family two-component response regulator
MSADRQDSILVIDDDESLRGALRHVLGRFGYRVHEAEDGEKGLQQALATKPAVILVDLRMPRMDGHTFLRRFAAQGLDAAVVATSADGDMDDVIDVMRNGAIDFLRKPWTQSELLAVVSRAAEIHGKRAAVRTPAGAQAVPLLPAPIAAATSSDRSRTADPFAKSLARLRQGEITLPSVPEVVLSLRTLIEDPSISVQKLARVLERDQRLVTMVFRMSASSRFAALVKTTDIHTALGRVGLREVHELVETTWVNDCFRIRDPRYHDLMIQIWRHSVARALAIRALAQAVHLDASAAYLGALLADVGACFLLWMVAEKSQDGPLPDPQTALPMLHEHHVPIGAQLLAKWGYTNEIVLRMVRGHHSTGQSTSDRYGSLLILADDLAKEVTKSADLTSSVTPSPDLVERCATELGITGAARRRIADWLANESEAVVAAIV